MGGVWVWPALGGHPPEVRIPAEMLFVESVAYTCLSPLGLVQWLCDNRHDEWPSTFAALRGVGIGSELVDWLELVLETAWRRPRSSPRSSTR